MMKQYFWGTLVVASLIGLLAFAVTAEAGLTVEDLSGTVEYAPTDALAWQPLTRDVILVAGNHIRTGPGASVGLTGEDGSVLYLGEDTELAIEALEYLEAQQKRIAKFDLAVGTLSAKAAPLDFATNVFEVETPSVIAGFKFSSLTIAVDTSGNSNITTHSGAFSMTNTATGVQQVNVTNVDNQGNVTEFSIPQGGSVEISIDDATGAITSISNTGTVSLEVMIGGILVVIPPGASIAPTISNGQLIVQNTSPLGTPPVVVAGNDVDPRTFSTPILVGFVATPTPGVTITIVPAPKSNRPVGSKTK